MLATRHLLVDRLRLEHVDIGRSWYGALTAGSSAIVSLLVERLTRS